MSRDSILIFRISKVYNRQYRLRIKAIFKWRVDGLVSKLGIPGPVRNIGIRDGLEINGNPWTDKKYRETRTGKNIGMYGPLRNIQLRHGF